MSPPDSKLNAGNSSQISELIVNARATASALREGLGIAPPRQLLPPKGASLASKIDHTLLKADAVRADVERVCLEARTHGFATVCLNSSWMPLASELLHGCPSVPISVVGFPLGAASTASKSFESRQAVADGAREIDMVIAIGPLKGGDFETVFRDIRAVVEASAPWPVKVILETSALTLGEKIYGCALSQEAGAAFVKTSTGFGAAGATVEDVRLMRQVVGPGMGVKASGGIRSYEDARRMIEAGADRIGASASVAIVTQQGAGAGGGY